MSFKKILFCYLGFLFCLPLSLIGWVLYLILYLFKQIDSVYVGRDLTMVWDINEDSWLGKKFFIGRGWVGFTLGCNVLILEVSDDFRWLETLKHERMHVCQFYKLGIFFPILYILESIRIYLFCKDLHSYYDNVYEIEAREYAGQEVKIPKELWKDGPNNRWFW